MKNIILLLFLFISFNIFSINFFSNENKDKLIDELISEMTPDEIIGQLFMIGLVEKEPDEFILEEIKKGRLGNIKIFGWTGNDVKDVVKSIRECQKKAANSNFSIPLFVATDQEGGLVRHIKGKTSITAGNLALGATKNKADTFMSAKYIASELKVLGINMNFAPDVDIFLDKNADLIGPRTFSSDIKNVTNLSIAFFLGQESEMVLSTAKHFPGHGRTGVDSHIDMPSIYINKSTLLETDLIPFRALIKEGIPVIMSGHLNFPYITDNKTSVSLSSLFLQDILREELKYDGLIITDDLLMSGARKPNVKYPNIPVESIAVGNDIVIISRDYNYYRAARRAAVNRYNQDDNFKEIANKAARRVLRYKIKYLKNDNSVPLYPEIRKAENSIPTKDATKFFQNQSAKSIVYKKSKFSLNLKDTDSVVLAGSYNNFFNAGQSRLKKSKSYFINYFDENNTLDSTVKKIEQLSNNDKIIILVSDRETAAIANRLIQKNNRIMVVSALNPYISTVFENRCEVIYIFGIGIHSFNACFAALLNDYNPTATMPITR